MKISSKILHIPPYISTSWKDISSLHVEGTSQKPILVVTLDKGTSIKIPNLSPSQLEEIFSAHASFLENSNEGFDSFDPSKALKIPLFGSPNMLKGMENLLQHDPQKASSPSLPKNILEKISEVSKIISPESLELLPEPEPHCNCPYCQTARAMRNMPPLSEFDLENSCEPIEDNDLKFREWDIEQVSEKLYIVSNPLAKEESYKVHLGDPIGCTCGNKNCEHIKAVLNT